MSQGFLPSAEDQEAIEVFEKTLSSLYLFLSGYQDLEKRSWTPTEGSIRIDQMANLNKKDKELSSLFGAALRKEVSNLMEGNRKEMAEGAYRLHYLVRLPLDSRNSMLNVSTLEHLFDYKLKVLTEKGPKVENVDLLETFNYLYGLHHKDCEVTLR